MTVRTATRIEDVTSVLEFAEREARSGSFVAVLLSYEAAPAFDSAFVTHPPSDFPLAWASVFETTCDGHHHAPRSSTAWTPLVTRDEYDHSVTQIRELIAAGDTYQVNYSFPLTSTFNGDARAHGIEISASPRAPSILSISILVVTRCCVCRRSCSLSVVEDGDYFLLPEHLARIQESAEYFGFVTQINAAWERIAAEHPEGSFKVRLVLWNDGRIETQITPIESLEEVRRVMLATEPVDSSDRFLFHKTTRRRGGDDVIFWNERGEVTESSIANLVVPIDGELFTPPIECGLLPGVFRNHLLARGEIKERVITIEEFQDAQEFFLINSIRKWIRIIRG